jgi:hypothetical protein
MKEHEEPPPTTEGGAVDQTAEAAQHLEQTRLLLEELSAALRMRRVPNGLTREQRAALARAVPKSVYENQGQRVVAGQRLMQAASDIFLGWLRGPAGRDFYWRQLRDMKGSAKVDAMSPDELALYAGLCGWALARAHARSGDRVRISAYLGKSERFDGTIADFAKVYADQIERDHAALCAAVKSGRIAADLDT